MRDDEKDKDLPVTDGFEGFEDRIEGDDQQQPGRLIQGERWAFTNEFVWMNGSGEVVSQDREGVAVAIERIVQKWVDQTPVKTIFLTPGERFPDINKMNETCPKRGVKKTSTTNAIVD
jgi:hypothetical protein